MLMKTGLSAMAEPSSLPENFDSGDGLPPTITRDYTVAGLNCAKATSKQDESSRR
jgi:hypothetical protein